MTQEPASHAMALVTAATQVDEEVGEASAVALHDMVAELVGDNPASYVASVITNLASYGSVVLGMVAQAVETDAGIIHQEMALAIAEQEQAS